MSRPIEGPRFAVCVETGEYAASLERWKIYRIVPDADAEAQSQVRVVDESGEDYLFPGSWFRAIELSEDLEARTTPLVDGGVTSLPSQKP